MVRNLKDVQLHKVLIFVIPFYAEQSQNVSKLYACEIEEFKVVIQNIQYSRKKRKSSYSNTDVNSYLNQPVKTTVEFFLKLEKTELPF